MLSIITKNKINIIINKSVRKWKTFLVDNSHNHQGRISFPKANQNSFSFAGPSEIRVGVWKKLLDVIDISIQSPMVFNYFHSLNSLVNWCKFEQKIFLTINIGHGAFYFRGVIFCFDDNELFAGDDFQSTCSDLMKIKSLYISKYLPLAYKKNLSFIFLKSFDFHLKEL